jgi:hypothetical protein
LGRWLQNDPLSFGAGDTNLYRAEGDNPVGRLDPSGAEVLTTTAVGAGAAGGWTIGGVAVTVGIVALPVTIGVGAFVVGTNTGGSADKIAELITGISAAGLARPIPLPEPKPKPKTETEPKLEPGEVGKDCKDEQKKCKVDDGPGTPGLYAGLEWSDNTVIAPGLPFTEPQKKKIRAANMDRNDNKLMSDDLTDPFQELVKSTYDPKVEPKPSKPPNEAQVDHIKAKANGGSNSYCNARVISLK